jgi:hypothetical protein
MEHPLIPSIDDLTTEELSAKITELNKKLSIAYKLANHALCQQIRMALETYTNKYQEKLRASSKGTDYDGMIDIT